MSQPIAQESICNHARSEWRGHARLAYPAARVSRQNPDTRYTEKGDGSAVFFFQAEDGIRDLTVTGVQTCALPISESPAPLAMASAFSARMRGVSLLDGSLTRSRVKFCASAMMRPFERPFSADARSEIGRASCRERV